MRDAEDIALTMLPRMELMQGQYMDCRLDWESGVGIRTGGGFPARHAV